MDFGGRKGKQGMGELLGTEEEQGMGWTEIAWGKRSFLGGGVQLVTDYGEKEERGRIQQSAFS